MRSGTSFAYGRALLACVGLLAWLGFAGPSRAVPAYARQTGQACVACHVSFPELTPYGRMFKLSGYTIGKRQDLPLALMAQVGVTDVSNNKDDQGQKIVPKTNKPALSAVSVFAAGKIRACPRFCVSGPLAGNCHLTRRHHESTQTRRARRTA